VKSDYDPALLRVQDENEVSMLEELEGIVKWFSRASFLALICGVVLCFVNVLYGIALLAVAIACAIWAGNDYSRLQKREMIGQLSLIQASLDDIRKEMKKAQNGSSSCSAE